MYKIFVTKRKIIPIYSHTTQVCTNYVGLYLYRALYMAFILSNKHTSPPRPNVNAGSHIIYMFIISYLVLGQLICRLAAFIRIYFTLVSHKVRHSAYPYLFANTYSRPQYNLIDKLKLTDPALPILHHTVS